MSRRTISSDQIPSVGEVNVAIGIACSHGVVVGPAIVLGSSSFGFPRRRVPGDQVDAEWARFQEAVTQTQEGLRAMIDTLEDEGRVEASILEAYLRLVRRLRGVDSDASIMLRREDLIDIADQLGRPRPEIVDRVAVLMGATGEQRRAMVDLYLAGATVVGIAS